MPRPTPPDDWVLDHVRERHNLSQVDVCGRSGIDVATYSRIEQGHASPKLDTLLRIARAIGVPVSELMHE